MAQETPGPTPEGSLIGEAAKASGRSIRQLAANAGISDTRWRQITRGWQENAKGKVIEARASDTALARMALVLELTPEDLVTVGRRDAAQELTRLLHGRLAVMEPRRADEIDLIYASKMSAREKLLRIRQVLELRVLAEAEEAASRPQPSSRRGPASRSRRTASSRRGGGSGRR